MTELFASLAGLGFGLFGGYWLGQRDGLSFVRQQLSLAGEAAEKMAQVLVAPYGQKQVVQVDMASEEAFTDLTADEERIPDWMGSEEDGDSQAS